MLEMFYGLFDGHSSTRGSCDRRGATAGRRATSMAVCAKPPAASPDAAVSVLRDVRHHGSTRKERVSVISDSFVTFADDPVIYAAR
ncbi:MAG: hypothetical protein ACLR4Z_19030 [Butyricicoccaceae bacterium]